MSCDIEWGRSPRSSILRNAHPMERTPHVLVTSSTACWLCFARHRRATCLRECVCGRVDMAPVSAVLELAAVSLFAVNLGVTLLHPPDHLRNQASTP